MTPELAYWLIVAALGLAAALGSFVIGLRYYGDLRREHPELVRSYWSELVRDALLVIGLGFNLSVGVLARPAPGPPTAAHWGVLGGATCLSLFAIFNFVLRTGR